MKIRMFLPGMCVSRFFSLRVGVAEDLTVFAEGRLQWFDWDIPRLDLFIDGEISGGSGSLAECHPGWFHADAGKGDVSRAGSDGNDR